MGERNLSRAYGGSRKLAHASSQRSSHGRQVASATHVQEGGQVSQREARREAPEGRGQGQDSDNAAGQATLKLCVTSPPADVPKPSQRRSVGLIECLAAPAAGGGGGTPLGPRPGA